VPAGCRSYAERIGSGQFLPIINGFFAAHAPGARRRGVQPVQRFAAAGGTAAQGGLHGGTEGIFLFRLDCARVNGNEQRRAAAGDEIQILPVQFPQCLPGVRGTVSIACKKSSVLRHPVGERVDAHPPGAFPDPARSIIAGALDFKQARAEMADGVAAEQHGIARARAQSLVEPQNNFRIGQRRVVKIPTALGQLRAHFKPPFAEAIVGGKIMLDQIVAPGVDACDIIGDEFEIFGQREIKRFFLGGAGPGAQLLRVVHAHQGRGSHPDAGTHAKFFHVGGEAGHVGKTLRVAGRPRTAGANRAGRPTRVNHAVGTVLVIGREFGEEGGVASYGFGIEVMTVGVIPVVVPADRAGGEPGCRTKQAAEPCQRRHRRFGFGGRQRHDGGGKNFAVTRLRRPAAIAKIKPQRNAGGIHRPETQRRWLRFHTGHEGG